MVIYSLEGLHTVGLWLLYIMLDQDTPIRATVIGNRTEARVKKEQCVVLHTLLHAVSDNSTRFDTRYDSGTNSCAVVVSYHFLVVFHFVVVFTLCCKWLLCGLTIVMHTTARDPSIILHPTISDTLTLDSNYQSVMIVTCSLRSVL